MGLRVVTATYLGKHVSLPFERVLVTGASGFVGCRVVEHLRLAYDVPVRAMIRTPSRAARVARLDAEIVRADLHDREAVAAAVGGCDAVVHCAYGSDGTSRERRATTGAATAALVEIARTKGVGSFVHLSSAAVHGLPPPEGEVAEEAPAAYVGHPYIDGKIDSERAVAESAERGLRTVVLRPTNVYGPWSELFTVAPVRAVREGWVALVGEGAGCANALYIDNLVHAIVLALTSDLAAGETFLVSDGTGLSWRELYASYARMLQPERPVRTISEAEFRRRRSRGGVSRLLRAAADRPGLRGIGRRLVGAVPGATETVRRTIAGDPHLPSEELARLQTSHTRFVIDKARALLRYEPLVGPELAMRLTREWLRFARLA